MGRSKFNKSVTIGGTRRVAHLPCGKCIKENVKRIKGIVQVHQKRCEICKSKDLSLLWKREVSKTPHHADFSGGLGRYGRSGGRMMTAINTETGEEVEIERPEDVTPQQVYEAMREIAEENVEFVTEDRLTELSQQEGMIVERFDANNVPDEFLESIGLTREEFNQGIQRVEAEQSYEADFETMEGFEEMTKHFDDEWIRLNSVTDKKKRSKARSGFIQALVDMIIIAEVNPNIPEDVTCAWVKYGKGYITMLDYSKAKAKMVIERYAESKHESIVEHPELFNYAKLMIKFCDAVKCCNSKELETICPQLKVAMGEVQYQAESSTENGIFNEGFFLKLCGTMKNLNEMISCMIGKDTKQLDAINKEMRSRCSKLI